MNGLTWQQRALPTPDLDLAWYEVGSGPTVLFLHGGPGTDHRYLRPLAEPLAEHFRCVMCDQRGSGCSHLGHLEETTLHVDRFVADIEALRTALSQDRLCLVGHSWGAELALLYGITYPEIVDRVVLLGLGPLTDELQAVARANLLRPLSRAERDEWATLSARRNAALEIGDEEAYSAVHARMMELRVRGWFYAPEHADRFVDFYLSLDSYNPAVAAHVVRSARQARLWDRVGELTAPALIVYGYQDFEPITQAYLLRERVPHARICLLNECGHLPWLEQPDAFYRELHKFLRDDDEGI